MKIWFITMLIMTLLASTSHLALGAEATGHEHHGEASTLSSEADGEKWETDKPLRTGMNRIRNAVQNRLHAFHQDRFTDEDARSLADEIDTNVNFMIENCELEPEADATLHALLAQVLEGKQNLAANSADPEGLPKIVNALSKYPRHFDHPGWEPLEDS